MGSVLMEQRVGPRGAAFGDIDNDGDVVMLWLVIWMAVLNSCATTVAETETTPC